MRVLIKILLFTVATLVLGCLLAPPLYWLGHAVAAAGWFTDLAHFEFHRYFNRAVLVAAGIMVWPLLRVLGIRRWADLGLTPNPARWRHLAVGFALSTVGLAIVGALMVVGGRAFWRTQMALDALPGAMLSAVVVGLLEESFFRGALLGALRRTMSWSRALGVLSVVFASLHFLKPPPGFRLDDVTWTSGFALFPRLFWQYGDPRLLAGGLLTILLVGLVLGYSVIRTRSLYLSLGLHIGWVFSLKGFGQLARVRGTPTLWLGSDLLTGLAPVLLVAATWAVVAYLFRDRGDRPVSAVPEPGVAP